MPLSPSMHERLKLMIDPSSVVTRLRAQARALTVRQADLRGTYYGRCETVAALLCPDRIKAM
jgi:hypothetical protein